MTALPGIADCRVYSGFDEGKDKDYMELSYKDVLIREYLPVGYQEMPETAQKDVMKMCVHRCRFRLEAILKREKVNAVKKKLKRIK